MKTDSILQKLEVHLVAVVAVVLVSGLAFLLSSPFSGHDSGVSDETTQQPPTSSLATPLESPALLEPALRSLDGVVYHG